MTTRSEARKLEWQDPVTRAKRLKKLSKIWFKKGHEHSPETIEKLRKKLKGRRLSPNTEFKKGDKKPKNAYSFGSGENNPSWKGDDVGYHGIHKRLHKKRLNICRNCGKEGKTEWANISGEYKSEEDFVELCISCHRKMDMTEETRRKISRGVKQWWKDQT